SILDPGFFAEQSNLLFQLIDPSGQANALAAAVGCPTSSAHEDEMGKRHDLEEGPLALQPQQSMLPGSVHAALESPSRFDCIWRSSAAKRSSHSICVCVFKLASKNVRAAACRTAGGLPSFMSAKRVRIASLRPAVNVPSLRCHISVRNS